MIFISINITKKTSSSNTTAFYNRVIKYIVIHYTAGSSSKAGSAANTAAMFGQSGLGASADFIVDDSTIVQFNPDLNNRYCWHCGDSRAYTKGGSYYGKCTNSNSIGIEVCSTNTNWKASTPANSPDWSFTDKAVENAVELTKYLMQVYNIPASNVIRHYDVSGKLCPGIIGWNADSGSEDKWQTFKTKLGGSATEANTSGAKVIYCVQAGAFSVKNNADTLLMKVKEKGFVDSFVTKVNGYYKVQTGAFAVRANAEGQLSMVRKAGFKDAFITALNGNAADTLEKTVEELAREVIAGKWGVGETRRKALTEAGYDYDAVQAEVNKLLE